jgi:hypothetical protein
MNRLIIGFFLVQVVFDLAHSVTALPFVHYGMFSESFPRPDSLSVYEIVADGKPLQAADFPIYQWDMVQNPLFFLEKQVRTRDFAFDKEKLSAGMEWAGLGRLHRLMQPNLDNAPNTAARFPGWYRNYLSSLIGHAIKTVRVDQVWYRYTNGHCSLIKRENLINI